jgi:predicted NBD/HSP70 family sugar kinase
MTTDVVPKEWAPLSETSRLVGMEVLLHGPLARKDLAERLKLSTASLSRLTKPLLDMGLLLEVPEKGVALGGRPPQPLDVNPDFQSFIGIKLTGTHAYVVRTNLRADIKESAAIEISDHGTGQIIGALGVVVDRMKAAAGGISGIGVGLGGSVANYRQVTRAPFLGWKDVPFADLLMQRFGVPAVLSNDLEALTEAENWFGDGRDVSNFAVLTIGVGVGGGLVVHDKLVTSKDSGLGLLGHFPLDSSGPACPDGHRGCANAMLSMDSIRLNASLAVGRAVTYDEVLDLAEENNPLADQIVGNAARAFGTLIAAVANVAVPERILITGEGIRLARTGWKRLQEGIAQSRIPAAAPLDVRVIEDDPMLWARGAASVAIQRCILSGG